MKICVYNAKGGVGKTPIAANIVLDREYAIGTNEHFQLFDTFISDDRILALESDEAFPEIPDDIDIVFDLAGSISEHSKSITSALKQADLTIIPIMNEVKSIYGGIGTIRAVIKYCPNILVVVTKLEKDKRETFNKGEWDKSQAFLNVQGQIQSEGFQQKIPCLPLKLSKVFDWIFEKEMSISQLIKQDQLARYNFGEVEAQFNEIYRFIDNGAMQKCQVKIA